MTDSEEKYFSLLKEQIVATMQKSYPGIPESVSEWKGQNIIDFQGDLEFRQKQHISEKWFYTHMKSENGKLPRIDVLNFLSKYVGAQSWEDFKYSQAQNEERHKKIQHSNFLLPLLGVIIITLCYWAYKSFYSQEYIFCFYDSISKQTVSNSLIEITLLNNKESDKNYLCDAEGCFTLKTNKNKVRFIVETAYYQTDTISRRLSSFNRSEKIKLEVDDYAIMIHYFSNSKVKDWIKRRDELDHIFSENAKIFQVYEGTVGMEIYNKWEFINKLTLPTNSLRDIEILDTKYKGERITHLRFKQN